MHVEKTGGEWVWLNNSEVVVVRSVRVAWFFENDLNEGFFGSFFIIIIYPATLQWRGHSI